MVEISCVLAAVLFTVANVLKIIVRVKDLNRPHDWDKYTQLDPAYLSDRWDFRISRTGLFLSAGFINAFAWVFLAFPMIQMAWLLSKQGKQNIGLNVSIAVFAVGGATTEWLSHFFWIGMSIASKKMVLNFNMDTWLSPEIAQNIGLTSDDGLGWKTLEVNHFATRGFIWYIDAFEWLCLAGIFLSTFISVRKWRRYDRSTFGARWNNLSMFMCLLAAADFVGAVLRAEGFRTAGKVAQIYEILNRLILLPAWIITLGLQLPRAAFITIGRDNDFYDDPAGDELAFNDVTS